MQRENWGSRFGFIMATAGSAIGLGNIWRFPYITGENGGGAFVFVYIVCVVFIGLPLLFNELALGRLSQKNPVGAVKVLGGNWFWRLGGYFSLSVSFFVLSYYGVIAGWTIGYIYTSLVDYNVVFDEFIASPLIVLFLFALFLIINQLIVQLGISKGIEKSSKILMPLLFGLLMLLIIRSLTLENSIEGIKYFLLPDFSKITTNVVLMAIGQVFFSMSIGWGILITYGSYLPKNEDIIQSGFWIAAMDLMVALLAGLMIFPAVFAFGKTPDQGTTLIFKILPEIFDSFPMGGNIIGAVFFALLTIAALTSSIAIIEVPISYLMDEKKMSRKKSSWLLTTLLFIVGVPSALASGGNEFFTNMTLNIFGHSQVGFLNITDYIFGNIVIVLAGLMMCIYTVWIYKSHKMVEEINRGNNFFTKKVIGNISPATLWLFFMKYICPVIIILLFLNSFNIFEN